MNTKKITLTTALTNALRGIFDYTGNISRSEYWFGLLGTIFLAVILYFQMDMTRNMPSYLINNSLGVLAVYLGQHIIWSICGILCWLIQIPLAIRRCHDIGISGNWMLIGSVVATVIDAINGNVIFTVVLGLFMIVIGFIPTKSN